MPETTDVRSAWGDAIRLERLARRLNQEDVAQLVGLDQTTVSKLEQGRGSLDSFVATARALGVALPEVA